MLSGDLARLTQVGLIIAAVRLALIWLPSDRLRGWLRVTAVKHLFKHRYDYRNEWIRFTRHDRNHRVRQHHRCRSARSRRWPISPTALPACCWCPTRRPLELAANWRWPGRNLPCKRRPRRSAILLETSELILDFDEARAGIDHHGELAHIPDWLLHDTRPGRPCPLLHFDRLVGLVILARPLVARKLDWEDFDLLARRWPPAGQLSGRTGRSDRAARGGPVRRVQPSHGVRHARHQEPVEPDVAAAAQCRETRRQPRIPQGHAGHAAQQRRQAQRAACRLGRYGGGSV